MLASRDITKRAPRLPPDTPQRVRISGGSDYALSANSDVVIITAGARQNAGGESRSDRHGALAPLTHPPTLPSTDPFTCHPS